MQGGRQDAFAHYLGLKTRHHHKVRRPTQAPCLGREGRFRVFDPGEALGEFGVEGGEFGGGVTLGVIGGKHFGFSLLGVATIG